MHDSLRLLFRYYILLPSYSSDGMLKILHISLNKRREMPSRIIPDVWIVVTGDIPLIQHCLASRSGPDRGQESGDPLACHWASTAAHSNPCSRRSELYLKRKVDGRKLSKLWPTVQLANVWLTYNHLKIKMWLNFIEHVVDTYN